MCIDYPVGYYLNVQYRNISSCIAKAKNRKHHLFSSRTLFYLPSFQSIRHVKCLQCRNQRTVLRKMRHDKDDDYLSCIQFLFAMLGNGSGTVTEKCVCMPYPYLSLSPHKRGVMLFIGKNLRTGTERLLWNGVRLVNCRFSA